jgi:chromosome segregation ATPase
MAEDTGAGVPDDDAAARLAEAERHIEALRAELAESRSQAAAAGGESARMSDELAATRVLLAEAQADVERLRSDADGAAARASNAVARYRETVVAREPTLPAELIAGASIEDIDASVESARALTAHVRERIAAEAEAARVPAGAPARAAPDVTALTPEQKIRLGLAQRLA